MRGSHFYRVGLRCWAERNALNASERAKGLGIADSAVRRIAEGLRADVLTTA